METPEQVREQMKQIAAARPDATKVWVDDHFGEQPKILPELYRSFIEAATGQSARCLGAENDIGTLLPGRQADFVVLDASPLADIRNSRKIASVWQRGVQVRGTILASLASSNFPP